MTILQKLAHWWRGKRPLPQIDPSVGEYHVINYTQATFYKSCHTKTEAQNPPTEPHHPLYPLARLVVSNGGRNVNTLACAPGLCEARGTCPDHQCPGHPGADANKHCPTSVALRPPACPRRGIVSYLPRRPLP